MTRRAFVFLLIVGFTWGTRSQPQHGTTNTIEIHLLENCDVREVWVVRDGLDRARIKATQPDPAKEPCRWTATLPGPQRYHTNISSFSLRLTGRGRSQCMKAEWDARAGAGSLIYSCCPGGDVFDVVVSSESPIGYSRSIPQRPTCIEEGRVWGKGAEEDRTIHDVQFDIETLRVQISERKPPSCGLIVHRLASMRKMQKQMPEEISGVESITVKPIPTAEVTAALVEQDVRGENCHATVLSAPNIDVIEKLALKTLSIQVK